MKLIVGLGNPGDEYKKTRHNIGFEVVDEFTKKYNLNYQIKFKGLMATGIIGSEKVIFLKPMTYMNLSGESVSQVVNFYKLDPEADLIVVYDDLDLPVGGFRIRDKGSSGGHNGIKSIIKHLGDNFIRIKCGIGKPPAGYKVADYVLGRFTKEESKEMEEIVARSIDTITELVEGKEWDRVVQRYNKKS